MLGGGGEPDFWNFLGSTRGGGGVDSLNHIWFLV